MKKLKNRYFLDKKSMTKSICKKCHDGILWTNIQGEYHREDGPAIEEDNGDKFWFIHNQLHRENGHASEFADGTKEWFWHGQHILVSSQEEFEKYLRLKSFW